jgi:SM-20-related protein
VSVAREAQTTDFAVERRVLPHIVIDDFLPSELAREALNYMLANEADFTPGVLRRERAYVADQAFRRGRGLAVPAALRDRCEARIVARFDEILAGVGVPAFPLAAIDLHFAVYRDGGFLKTHVDTMTGANRDPSGLDRVISAVWYAHTIPKRFSGGELVIKSFAEDGDCVTVEPLHNRLVAFPSFARHEVLPTRVPGDAFSDARFSMTIWLLRDAR